MLQAAKAERAWQAANMEVRLLATDAARRALVQGREVLEIGAGTGVVGIAAAKLGAARVVLTDNEPAVLANLRACVHLNAGGGGADDGSSSGGGGEAAGGGAGPASQDTTSMLQAAKAERAWQAANMEVRLLEWADDLAAHDGGGGSGEQQQQVEEQQQQQQEQAESDSGALPPRVDANERFPLLLGNETMYEPEHATLVAAVIARRLARGGVALLCSAVRFREVFAAFEAACAARGLRHRSAPIAPAKGDADGGILRDDYDGGFRLMAVDWADAHASPEWAPEPRGWGVSE
jgi:predicted nicotinamide N-methyase